MSDKQGPNPAIMAGLAAGVVAVVAILWYAQRPAAPVEPAALVSEAPGAAIPEGAGPEGTGPETAAAPEALATAGSAPEELAPEELAPEELAIEPVATAEPETAATPTSTPPGFDTVRIAPDGAAVVAGRAGAGSTVVILVDGIEVARADADATGSFVALFDLPPSADARLMTLVALSAEGEMPSEQSVAIAPVQSSEAVAEATPETPEATAQAASEASAPEAPPSEAPPNETVVAETVAEAAPTAILVDDSGAQVLQGAGAGVGVSIAAITYTPDGAVQLAGSGTPGALIRLYLDNALAAEAPVNASGGWVTKLRDVAPRLYTLRADQIGGDGKVTARSETPFLREAPAALAAAMKPRAVRTVPLGAGSPVPEAQGPAKVPAAVTALAQLETPVPDGNEAAAPQPVAEPEATATPEAPVATGAEAAPLRPVSVTVQPGFTLWRIARENFGDGVMYVKVFDANKDQIRNPDLIYPGQVFLIPDQ
ncbi:LysM peptidoglycan-binding domain-containing protein [Gemmobacter lutimaris]|uniref:LysM peptidoglycan-binding domain-containing protein n=1 Tax=Gemmobacter lutimaris TaxID=2306023 RepID=UPI001F479E45|nr:LysM peptidoglycan-binding domain-containing protein [Gemmobacter lutimaris]